ncbi:MAG: hypothetical protein IPN13_18240 [Bacteroidetes bacterium]|nr:hypothetical protein [Bacteroidota bacterium]
MPNNDNTDFRKQTIRHYELRKVSIVIAESGYGVEEDTFRKCVDFMDPHPDAGGLGYR